LENGASSSRNITSAMPLRRFSSPFEQAVILTLGNQDRALRLDYKDRFDPD
jgi:hypothetical protein